MKTTLMKVALISMFATPAMAQSPWGGSSTTSQDSERSGEYGDEDSGAAEEDGPDAPGAATEDAPETPSAYTAATPAYVSYDAESSATESARVSASDADIEAPKVDKKVLHGFRVGYGYIFNHDEDPDGDGSEMSLEDEFDITNEHNFLLGYEVFYRLIGQDWLNVLLVGNVTVAGLEQSKFMPQANGLIGAEINESFQLGVGVNVTPEPDRPAHMIMAAGWTPKAGSFYVPLHIFFIPDVDGFHRTGITTGVTW